MIFRTSILLLLLTFCFSVSAEQQVQLNIRSDSTGFCVVRSDSNIFQNSKETYGKFEAIDKGSTIQKEYINDSSMQKLKCGFTVTSSALKNPFKFCALASSSFNANTTCFSSMKNGHLRIWGTNYEQGNYRELDCYFSCLTAN